MNIKILIGQRITEARKALNLSQVELAEVSGFGKSRISNWETGFRTPRLEEAKILEKILHVPAPYLLSLSDTKEFPHDFGKNKSEFKSIPIFTEQDLLKIDQPVQMEMYNTENYLPIVATNEQRINDDFFAFQLNDESMAPDFSENDIVVFNPYARIRHNDNALIKIKKSNEILFRKYFIDTSIIGKYIVQLIPINPEWITTKTTEQSDLLILGVMSSIQRIFT